MREGAAALSAMSPGELAAFLLALVALAFLLLALFWPLLFPTPLRRRVRRLRAEGSGPDDAPAGEDAAQRHVSRLTGEVTTGWFDPLYPPLYRLSHYTSHDLGLRLKQAGYHGRRALVMFMLAKLTMPIIAFPLAWAYLDLTLSGWLPGPLVPLMAAGIAIAAFWAADLFLKNITLRRQERIKRSWPDALVLMQLCIESGLGLEAAISKVAQEIREISPDIADEFSITLAELIYFQNRREALENLGERIDLPIVREVTLALAQAERYGMALGATLNSLAAESRRVRLSEAERKAAALPARLTVPMILFFLPALFVVILTPAIIQVFELN